MENKYFNKWEFLKALDFVDTNPLEAKLKFEEYLQKYPEDYSAYSYYIHALIMLGEFENAERILNFVESESIQYIRFNKNTNKVTQLKQHILFSRLKLLMYQQKYKDAYHLYSNNSEKLGNVTLNSVIFYCKSKIGKLDFDKRDINPYLFRQIVEYKKSDFLEHIQKHLADYNVDLDGRSENVFVPSFPINAVIEEIEKYIPSTKSLHPGFYDDVYIFKYNECGRENCKVVDYFKVICFHNTSNFITMYPASNCQDLPYVDLNYLIRDKENTKIKKLSQIEKFNRKYRNN